MSTWKAEVTEKGDALLAKMTQGRTLDITHAEIGAGQVDITLLKQQTSVSTVKQTATVEPVGYPEEGMCALPVTITNEGVEASYSAWQIGVFANDPDEGKILFFLAQAVDNATNIPSAALMPSYNTQIIFFVEYGSADSVTVDVNPANTVSQAGMENYVGTQIAGVKAQIAGITAESLGLGNVDNTADNDKYVAYAQRSGVADKVPNALTVRVNGGRTEGTDQWTYDGSVSKAINITPAKIGAAEASHEHSADDISAGVLPITRGGLGAGTVLGALSNLGLEGALKFTTVWSNSSPASSFPAQTLSLSEAEGLYGPVFWIVEWRIYSDNSNANFSEIVPVSSGYRALRTMYVDNAQVTLQRQITFSGAFESIWTFEDCKSNGVVNNKYLIPLAIHAVSLNEMEHFVTEI